MATRLSTEHKCRMKMVERAHPYRGSIWHVYKCTVPGCRQYRYVERGWFRMGGVQKRGG